MNYSYKQESRSTRLVRMKRIAFVYWLVCLAVSNIAGLAVAEIHSSGFRIKQRVVLTAAHTISYDLDCGKLAGQITLLQKLRQPPEASGCFRFNLFSGRARIETGPCDPDPRTQFSPQNAKTNLSHCGHSIHLDPHSNLGFVELRVSPDQRLDDLSAIRKRIKYTATVIDAAGCAIWSDSYHYSSIWHRWDSAGKVAIRISRHDGMTAWVVRETVSLRLGENQAYLCAPWLEKLLHERRNALDTRIEPLFTHNRPRSQFIRIKNFTRESSHYSAKRKSNFDSPTSDLLVARPTRNYVRLAVGPFMWNDNSQEWESLPKPVHTRRRIDSSCIHTSFDYLNRVTGERVRIKKNVEALLRDLANHISKQSKHLESLNPHTSFDYWNRDRTVKALRAYADHTHSQISRSGPHTSFDYWNRDRTVKALRAYADHTHSQISRSGPHTSFDYWNRDRTVKALRAYADHTRSQISRSGPHTSFDYCNSNLPQTSKYHG